MISSYDARRYACLLAASGLAKAEIPEDVSEEDRKVILATIEEIGEELLNRAWPTLHALPEYPHPRHLK